MLQPMSSGLPSAEPQLTTLVIELSSMATPRAATASPPYLEYHLSVTPSFKEGPFEEQSSTASCTPQEVGPSHRGRRIDMISKHPLRIRAPHIP